MNGVKENVIRQLMIILKEGFKNYFQKLKRQASEVSMVVLWSRLRCHLPSVGNIFINIKWLDHFGIKLYIFLMIVYCNNVISNKVL